MSMQWVKVVATDLSAVGLRPRTCAPVVATRHLLRHFLMDVIAIRGNDEDLYAGIEHPQTRNVS